MTELSSVFKKKCYLFVLLFPFFIIAQQQRIDSLYTVLSSTKVDTVKIGTHFRINDAFKESGEFPDSSFFHLKEAYAIAAAIKNARFSRISQYYIAQHFIQQGYPDSALAHYNSALSFVTDKRSGYMEIVSGIANVYFLKGEYIKAYEYYLKFLRQAEISGSYNQKARAHGNVGVILKEQNKFDEAIPYFKKSIEYSRLNKDEKGTCIAYVNLANVYYEKSKLSRDSMLKLLALEYYNKARPVINYKNDFNMRVASVVLFCNLGNIYADMKQYNKSVEAYNESVKLIEEHGYLPQAALVYNNLAGLYVDMKQLDKAEKILKVAQEATEKSDSFDNYAQLYQIYASFYEKKGDFKKAFYNYKNYKKYSDSLFNTDNTERRKELELNYEFEKKEAVVKAEQEKKEAIANHEKKQQRIILYTVIAGLGLTLIFAVFVYKGYRSKKKANEIITIQKKEVEESKLIIEKQKEIVEEKQKEVLDSIHYAKRIQDALFAGNSVIEKNLGSEFFIYFNPKDIVSGDFYWATEHGDYFFLAVCDSTGHGVPGAFMSLLNIGFMSEAINEKSILEPNEVFNYVRMRLVNSISKEGQKDGFDGILLRLNKSNNSICYAASHNKPVLVKDETLIELPCDKMPVGKGENEKSFTLFKVAEKNGFLYLFTDGYADQFGGEKGKKLKYKSLYNMLALNATRPANQQREDLHDKFAKWKGELEQVDDVLVIGLKI